MRKFRFILKGKEEEQKNNNKVDERGVKRLYQLQNKSTVEWLDAIGR